MGEVKKKLRPRTVRQAMKPLNIRCDHKGGTEYWCAECNPANEPKPPESVIDRRVRLLKEQTSQLALLLDDPHPGLITWMTAVPAVVRKINEIMEGKRDG